MEKAAENKAAEMKEASESSDSKRFHCPEVLSQPNFIGKDAIGIHDATFQPIMMTKAPIRKDRYINILLSGGIICSRPLASI